jgi:ABC-type lipoprotein release transport system permease subunit
VRGYSVAVQEGKQEFGSSSKRHLIWDVRGVPLDCSIASRHSTEYDYLPAVAVVSLVLLAVALACFVPARRASRIDPILALQHE